MFSTTAPFMALLTAVIVNSALVLSTSVSLPFRSACISVTGVSSAVVAVSSTATGASFTGETVIVTSPVSVNVPSETVYSKLAVPLKSAAGVKVIVPFMFSTTAPFTALFTAVTVSASPSTSKSLPVSCAGQRQRHVFVGVEVVVDRHRRVVHRRDVHQHGRGVKAAVTIANRVCERVGAGVVRIGRVEHVQAARR